ncbi:aspartate 4-decarboxylase [Alicyclobacillus cycloheptanicus]|uniref:Aminotransferase n=1 Tax=Alicyclobacillus cycloheptanicus TaxID=1457 RepID=A0ABT9XFY2_9BACL|nr:aspartate 4-decarboxylase [Alicyclobacillus cycloheptanicus]MDQ0189202.1 aspartate 4-decarboxylase [Alicyclobacillus cycloheptanicus]
MSTYLTDEQRRVMERSFEAISPFEFKNKLIELAKARQQKSARAMLDAGRGNPNWIATTPRASFFALGQFALQESRRVWEDGHIGGKPASAGIAGRFKDWADRRRSEDGVALLANVVDYGIQKHQFDPDLWVHELVDGIIGDNYPEPDRMLKYIEQIVHDYVVQELCQGEPDTGPFDLFAVEGATAAMCYIFDSLQENCLLNRGDKVAIMVPIFPPYVEIAELARYQFDVVEIKASAVDAQGNHTWQYPDEEIDKLRDPSVKALFLVNPSNPPSVALRAETVARLKQIVAEDNPNLMIISDDVYCTFVDGFRSLLAELPFHTVGVYSFSKYFGVTGWRLGVVALHRKNVFDQLLRGLPNDKQDMLAHRYSSLTEHPSDLSWMSRLVADSRQVALNHTAGLSTPQQVQMALFCGFALLDKENQYKHQTQDICQRRMALLYEGLGLPEPRLQKDADYYTEFDLAEWSTKHYGKAFTDYLQANYEPVDVLFRLAEHAGIVLLNGGGFHGPTWSIRVSLANLDDEDYTEIGKALHEVLAEYVAEWKQGARP